MNSHLGSDSSNFTIDLESFNKLAKRLERNFPIHQMAPDLWIDPETNEKLNAYEVVSRFGGLIDGELDDSFKDNFEKWRKDKNYIPKVHLIEAQRLIKLRSFFSRTYRDSREQSVRDTVMEYSQQLKQRINVTLAEYGKQAQKLDQTFPQRLLQQGGYWLMRSRLKKI